MAADPSDHVARALELRCEICKARPGNYCDDDPYPPGMDGVHTRRVIKATYSEPWGDPRRVLDRNRR